MKKTVCIQVRFKQPKQYRKDFNVLLPLLFNIFIFRRKQIYLCRWVAIKNLWFAGSIFGPFALASFETNYEIFPSFTLFLKITTLKSERGSALGRVLLKKKWTNKIYGAN